MKQTYLQAFYSRIPFVDFPNNPRNKKEAPRERKYLFVSTEFIQKKDENGIINLHIIGKTCKRTPAKPLSKRDIHRQKGN